MRLDVMVGQTDAETRQQAVTPSALTFLKVGLRFFTSTS
jgi:hypothetical protein